MCSAVLILCFNLVLNYLDKGYYQELNTFWLRSSIDKHVNTIANTQS
jgi:hypothetical protein